MASAAPPATSSWDAYRGQLETYFDRTAVDAWAALTSDAPVSRVRATVRAGRTAMRTVLLDWLPGDMTGLTLLDAGCGTGALAVAAARRGARVTAIDISGSLVSLAQARAPARFDDEGFSGGSIDWRVGDMLSLGAFDHVVAMDSLIHYPAADIARTVTALTARTRRSLAFTFAPRSPLLAAMHTAGKLFPRADRAPAIVPVAEATLRAALSGLDSAIVRRSERVSGGFYTSHALEVVRT
ncbi:MAG: magnesium protoporphyrin IX methyltransferase [Sphingomonadaceae bacterium]|nr:magnesium protoporphyrin IX methyltransferase [Sphingomonadaceae bacterium]